MKSKRFKKKHRNVYRMKLRIHRAIKCRINGMQLVVLNSLAISGFLGQDGIRTEISADFMRQDDEFLQDIL